MVEGRLDPAVDVSELLTINLVDPDLGDELRVVLASIYATRVASEAQAQEAAEQDGKRKKNEPKIELPPEPRLAGPDADPLTRARSELALAYWQFLTLPAERRAELLAQHAEHQAMIAQNREAKTRAEARLVRLSNQAKWFKGLIEGDLDVAVDPVPLLRLDLSKPNELATDDRLARALGYGELEPTSAAPGPDQPQTDPKPDQPQPDQPSETAPSDVEPSDVEPSERPDPTKPWEPSEALAAATAAAEADLDAQRLRFLALSTDERRALLDLHAKRQREADQAKAAAESLAAAEELVPEVEADLNLAEDKAEKAKRERMAAQEAASQARSEALRRIAEERARLLGVKEAHAIYEVELAKRAKDTLAAHEVALEWDRRVTELALESPTDSREANSDGMYSDLREALGDARDRLRDTLKLIANSDSGVAPVGEPLAGLPQDVDRSDLSELRAELEASEAALREIEREALWESAHSGRDDIVMLNRARLTLLDLGSSDLRSRMTGFGQDGVEQVKREIDQIGLELRYRIQALPRLARGLFAQLESSPLPLIFSAIKLGFLLLLFRYWRRRAEPTLDRMRDGFLAREEGNPRINAALALGVWYFSRIRKPLELLLLFGVMYRIVPTDSEMLELEVAWLVILWLLLGSAVILLVDAVAAHENLVHGRASNVTARLRIKSLRLVGLTIVWTGLVLSLTEQIVGLGAIHKWVGTLVWIAAIPILLVLIRWWREHAFRRFKDDPDMPDNALVRWIRANTTGWTSFPTAAIAGGYLFGRGLMRWLLRRATALEATRRLLAWMFRREVARQATARREDEQPVRPLAPRDYAKLDPGKIVEVEQLSPDMEAIASDILDEITELVVAHRGTLSAVIGERGSGKSMFLRRLEAAFIREAQDFAQAPDADADASEDAEAGEDADASEDADADANTDAADKAAKARRHAEFGRLTIRRIQCPTGGFTQLQRAIAKSVGLDPDTPAKRLIAALAEQTPLVFLIDDVHRLVRPAIGGLEGLDRFTDFAREVGGDASWVATIGAAAWQYVSRSRGERVFFDQVLKLPRWNEQQIGELIRARSEAAALDPSFDEIVIPRQYDVTTTPTRPALGRASEAGDEGGEASEVSEFSGRPTDRERAEVGFYRILWDHAKGNPAVALHFWRESLCVVSSAEGASEVKVRLFTEPPAAALDEVSATLHFVLRGVVQLGIASPEDLVACTQLPPADVSDALRFAVARGWVDRVGKRGDRFCVTWHWYRAITDMLRRQHLLEI
ncbi:Cdc6-related protein [Enhygromyxa salina]|uniref:Cdc6-related protein n=1 Tax=Enhygromyxa salina TaxID=215803 RepID=A0A0C2CUF6_9BACT|nr:Cdc6-related protein [Enhygromyxa salina]